MMYDTKDLGKLLAALLIGLIGAVGILLLLSRQASAGPLMQTAYADLEIAKAGSPATAIAGESLTYTLTITNSGPSTATSVIVTDTLPAGVTVGSVSPKCGHSGRTVTCTLGDLVRDHTATLTAVVTVNSSVTGTISNSAIVTATTTDTNTVNNTASEETTVTTEADLSVAKSANPSTVIAGHNLTYTIAITNNGPSDATGVTLTDTLPAELAFGTASAGCTHEPSEHRVICNIGSRISHATATITTTGTVTSPLPNGTPLINTATIGGGQADPDAENNTAQAQATVQSAPILSLVKRDDPEPVEAGAELVYTLTFTNTGNEIATGVILTDVLDSHVTYSGADPPAEGTDHTRYWVIGDLAPGEPSQVVLTVTVASPLPNHTILNNTAWLDTDQTAPLSAAQQTTVTSRPVLAITKTDFPDPVDAHAPLRYTLIITNSGNENATPVTVTEHYDPNVSFFSAIPDPVLGSGGRTWTFPSLAAGTSKTINIFVNVADDIPAGTVLTNEATLESGQTAPVTATEVTSVTSAVDFTFYKIALSDPVEAGEALQYIIHYGNFGTSAAYNVVITETYDSRVTFRKAVPSPKSGTNNVWELGTVEIGDVGDILVTVDVTTPLPNEAILTNRATIDSRDTPPWTTVETTTVSSATDLAFSVTDVPDPVEAGDPLTYTLRYTNAGNADATDVVITATFDSNVSFSATDATPQPNGGSGQIRYWNFESIPGEGGSGEIVIRTNVTLPLTNGTKLNFTAQLADAEDDFLERTARTTAHSAPALSLLKSDGVSNVEAGDRLTYTLTYANSGNENAYHVIITDTLSPYVEYIGCDGCQPPDGPDPDTVVFHISAITQTSRQVQLFVQVQDPLPAGADFVENHARMTHSSLPAPIDASDIDFIDTRPDLAIIEANHTPTLFSPGQLMTYTMTYGNVGQHMHTENVIITTVLPTDTVYVADPVGNGWHSSDGQTYTYAAGALPVGSTGHTITFTVRHPDAAQVSAPEFKTPFTIAASGGAVRDANPGDNKVTVIIGVPDLVVVDCTFEPSPLPPNVPVTFTVVLKNQGTGMAWNPESCRGPVCAPFYLDVFIDPVVSYPYDRDGDFYTTVGPIEPGTTYTYTLKHGGFENGQMQKLYVKVDNHDINPYGLVPESVEMNNVALCIDTELHHIYLPLVTKQ